MFNPAPACLIDAELMKAIDILVVNEVEAAFYCKTEIDSIEKAKEEAERLSEEALDRLHTLLGEDTFLEELIRSLVNRRK